ncbi:efflux RND transporter periplasmic adaptor subunit [Chitinophaga sp. 212800010-3]|uniref:efflux RND transporter periplasmic adaptor subunit n=1 Tax=unclassified Chitinophaga TaxID=2619133 RepID=UPI002DE5A5FB|nr:HlyD-D23 domain-containing protein [Chitinophaga sp. 212800010-3]
MNQYKHIILTGLIFSAMVMGSCGGNKKQEPQKEATEAKGDSTEGKSETEIKFTEEQYKMVGIETRTLEKRSLSGTLKVNGYLEVPPQNLVSITAQMGGIIQSTPLLQGSAVKKGQVIAVMQNQDYVQLQQDYLDTKSQLDFASAEYDRQQELARENVNAKKTLQQAKSQFYSLQAKLSGIKQKLLILKVNPERLTADNISGSINVYSPVDGYVTKVNVNVGKFVNSNDVMFEIVNGANLHVELNVFEKDIPKIKVNQKVRFKLANDNTERIATISLIGKEINPDKTIRVHSVTVDGMGVNFIPGTYFSAVIETNTVEVDALPAAAVVDFEGKKYVFILKEGHSQKEHPHDANEKNVMKEEMGESYLFEIVEVSTGISEEGYIEVQLPNNIDRATAKIVTKGTYDLLSKLKNSEEE